MLCLYARRGGQEDVVYRCCGVARYGEDRRGCAGTDRAGTDGRSTGSGRGTAVRAARGAEFRRGEMFPRPRGFGSTVTSTQLQAVRFRCLLARRAEVRTSKPSHLYAVCPLACRRMCFSMWRLMSPLSNILSVRVSWALKVIGNGHLFTAPSLVDPFVAAAIAPGATTCCSNVRTLVTTTGASAEATAATTRATPTPTSILRIRSLRRVLAGTVNILGVHVVSIISGP